MKKLSRYFTLLVKFDRDHPFGIAQEAFQNVSRRIADHRADEFLVGHVGVGAYGGYNKDLAAKHGAEDTSKWPVYKIFHRNGVTVDFHGNHDDEGELAAFVQAEVHIDMGEGTIKELDEMARRFLMGNRDARHLLLHEVDAEAVEIVKAKPHLEAVAKLYVRIMHRMYEKGDKFAHDEIARVKKLLRSSKISEAKQAQLRDRLKVLQSFTSPLGANPPPGTYSKTVEL
ncbi:hypothetical protein CTAYLR_006552 [Chrysophaeum taylorii]|uniref:Uncharacterized protein n=1 Tax=Chrysophaeum taylorii TaxID=2483200 RepID=A0AAD7UHX0_9STRA|nr:hypothetical protein CTAYLR_006552 [Chrysophaeum taylorii]